MHIRPLTDPELERIREVKQLANDVLKLQRQEITRQIKKMLHGAEKELMQWKRDHIKDITGKPVIVSLDGEGIGLNYELLQRLNRSLEKRGWHREINIKRNTLTIQYPRGIIELNEFPAYQLDVLGDLPVVDLKYGFDFLN